ncbi:MAG: Gfo/Idh/MocA family oxidoreductase [Cyanobacteria bacterium J06650_10]
MTAALKSAVIGTGVISKQHLSFLQGSELANIVGVCDLSPAAANYAADTFGAVAAYTNYTEMLEKAKPDVVHILTPPKTHFPIATDCLQAGSHVICEKPVAPSYTEFKDLWKISRDCDRVLIEDHNYRFNGPVREIKDIVAAGDLGEIQDVEIRIALNVRSGGRYADTNLPSPSHKMPAGVIHDFITHLSYLLLEFLPDIDFDRISAAWSNHAGDELFKYDDLDALVISRDGSHGRLRFSCSTSPECFSLTVRGDKGYAETDLFQPYLRCVKPRSGGQQLSPLVNHFVNGWSLVGASARNFKNKVMQKTPYEGLHYLLGQTYATLSVGQAPPISFDDMARTSQLVEALLAEENRL